jgi:hypothetical protein
MGSRKRKADTQPDINERLSKRLSLLNLEHRGQKLYVPVESAQRTDASLSQPRYYPQQTPPSSSSLSAGGDEPMQLDNTKHKVYIYSLDEELSSESDVERGGGDQQQRAVVFLPDIEERLRVNRIPQSVLLGHSSSRQRRQQQQQQPDLEDTAAKQLVLYQVPSSISVPEERDSVRKAIIEARQRVRERQEAEREGKSRREYVGAGVQGPATAMTSGMFTDAPMEDDGQDDSDAMELD